MILMAALIITGGLPYKANVLLAAGLSALDV